MMLASGFRVNLAGASVQLRIEIRERMHGAMKSPSDVVGVSRSDDENGSFESDVFSLSRARARVDI